MFCLHVYNFSRLKFLLVLALIIVQAACSGDGGGGEGSVGVAGVEKSVIDLGFPTSSITLHWTAPTLRNDGSTPLELSEIRGYRIYYGTSSGVYTNFLYKDGFNSEVTIKGAPPGTYNMVIVTIDTAGRESKYSLEFIVTAEIVQRNFAAI